MAAPIMLLVGRHLQSTVVRTFVRDLPAYRGQVPSHTVLGLLPLLKEQYWVATRSRQSWWYLSTPRYSVSPLEPSPLCLPGDLRGIPDCFSSWWWRKPRTGSLVMRTSGSRLSTHSMRNAPRRDCTRGWPRGTRVWRRDWDGPRRHEERVSRGLLATVAWHRPPQGAWLQAGLRGKMLRIHGGTPWS